MVDNSGQDDILEQEYIGDPDPVENPVQSTSSTVTKQRFITRVFHEQDNQVIGVEVIVRDDDNNVIDNIIVADETKLKQFEKDWEEISNYYFIRGDVDLPEDLREKVESGELSTLQDILKNPDGNTDINATTLNGLYTSDSFALEGHDHDDIYCTTLHQSDTENYGIGTNSLYGHVKIADHLNDSVFTKATALSSHQGYELNQKINEIGRRNAWSDTIAIGDYMRYRVNPDLRLLVMNYNRNNYTGCKTTTGSHVLHGAGTIPSYYCPTSRVLTPLYRGDFVLYYNSDGTVTLYNLTKKDTINIHAQVMWHY